MADKQEDLLVFITRGEVVCDECGEDLGRHDARSETCDRVRDVLARWQGDAEHAGDAPAGSPKT